MDIVRPAISGTLESCDAAVTVEPRDGEGIELAVESADHRFSSRVRAAAESALAELGVASARVTVRDRNALDCTVRARVLSACLRAAGRDATDKLPWEYIG